MSIGRQFTAIGVTLDSTLFGWDFPKASSLSGKRLGAEDKVFAQELRKMNICQSSQKKILGQQMFAMLVSPN